MQTWTGITVRTRSSSKAHPALVCSRGESTSSAILSLARRSSRTSRYVPSLYSCTAGFLTWASLLQLKIEDPLAVNDQQSDDEISEWDEDSLAGQMAAMHGGKVKKCQDDEEDSDEESDTHDDDKDSNSSSDSDND